MIFAWRVLILAAMISSTGVIAQVPNAQPSNLQPVERSIHVDARPFEAFSVVDRAKRQFGQLTFLGGLDVRSADKDFGGISGAILDPDSQGFIAVTDHGDWIRGRLSEKDGLLTGMEGVSIAPMLSASGRPLKKTQLFDAEGIVRVGRQVYVSVERVHAILRYDWAARHGQARASAIELPPEMKQLNFNQGIEALGILPSAHPSAGALIAIAEHPSRRLGGDTFPGWILGGKAMGRFGLRRTGDFDVTDLGFLPGGDMLVLERRFKPFSGVAMRIRRIPLREIAPGAILDGETLIEADMSHQVDNMEAMIIHRRADGKIILTLFSDDNFSLLQRNLVLRFAYDE